MFAYEAVTNDDYKEYILNHKFLYYICLVVSLLSLIAISCFRSISRQFPYNYLVLLLFTLCEAYLISVVCAKIGHPIIIFQAFALTSGIFLSLTMYAMFTKIDFTGIRIYLFLILSVLIFAGVIMLMTNCSVG